MTAKVVLKSLMDWSDDLNIIVKASKDQWQYKADKEKLNYMQTYKDEIFNTYGFPKEEIIMEIASARYETRENNAVAYFMKREDIDQLLIVEEEEKASVVSFLQPCYQAYKMGIKENISSTRKMLETCRDSERYLLVEQGKNHYLRGIVTKSKIGKIADEELSIHFMGKSEWKVCKGQETFLVFRNNQYYTDDSRIDTGLEDKIANMVRIAEDKREKFKNIFQKMESQQHGALMIVTEDAGAETDRLCSKYQRGMQIDALDLDNEDALDLVSGLASIDGAVMIDFEGKCYGFGVILDGEARIKGNTGRGARYNSSTNYIAGKERYSVIISEDRERGIEILYGPDQKIIP